MNLEEVFQEKIVEVSEAFPSIYTKDDVVKLLINIKNILEDVDAPKANLGNLEEKINCFEDDFRTIIRDKIESYDFDNSVELELRNHNEIMYEVDADDLANEIEYKIEELFREFKESFQSVEAVED
jgi:DNA repair exonuclease SbcCD ATPase subunit